MNGGLEAVCRAFVEGRRDVDASALPAPIVRLALQRGLGPLLVHVGALAAERKPPFADEIRASDLTARLLTAEKFDVLRDLLRRVRTVETRPVLLKGAATSLRYYPEPHLRMMGDIDILVDPQYLDTFEGEIRALGFVQRSRERPGWFIGRHHTRPFVHPTRPVWIEVHTGVVPRECPLARTALVTTQHVMSRLVPMTVGDQVAYAMSHEMQLAYTSGRWAEGLDPERGIFPMLDVALLLRAEGSTLDWDRVCGMVQGTWAATALHVMLTHLERLSLATVPTSVLRWLDAHDPHVGRSGLAVLQRMTSRFLLEGRPFGRVLTTYDNVDTVWRVIVRPSRPLLNFARIPYSLAGTFYRSHLAKHE